MTDGGILLTKFDETTPLDGEVISVGSAVKENIKVGSRVNCEKYKGLIFWKPGDKNTKYLSIHEADVVGVWE